MSPDHVPTAADDLRELIERVIHTAFKEGFSCATHQAARAEPEGLWPYGATEVEEVYRDWRTYGPGAILPYGPDFRRAAAIGHHAAAATGPGYTQAQFDARTAEQRADPEYRAVMADLQHRYVAPAAEIASESGFPESWKIAPVDGLGPTEQL